MSEYIVAIGVGIAVLLLLFWQPLGGVLAADRFAEKLLAKFRKKNAETGSKLPDRLFEDLESIRKRTEESLEAAKNAETAPKELEQLRKRTEKQWPPADPEE